MTSPPPPSPGRAFLLYSTLRLLLLLVAFAVLLALGLETSDQSESRRGLSVRLSLRRDSATAEIHLGDAAKFFPTDAALAGWMAQADKGLAKIVYE